MKLTTKAKTTIPSTSVKKTTTSIPIVTEANDITERKTTLATTRKAKTTIPSTSVKKTTTSVPIVTEASAITERKATTATKTKAKTTPSTNVKTTTTSMPNVNTEQKTTTVCNRNSDCNNNGMCVSGQCDCSCLFTGTRCETVAQCYEVSMVIETLLGEPAEFSPALSDPTSDEFMAAVQTLLPFIEELISTTETAVNQYLAVHITGFKDGSLVVDYVVSLKEGPILSNAQLLEEMKTALSKQDSEDFTVKEGSLEVTAVHISTTSTRRPSTLPARIPTPPARITQPPITCPPITCDSEYGILDFKSSRVGFASYSDQRCLCDTRSIGTLLCPMDATLTSSWDCNNIEFRCDIGNINQQLQELSDLCYITDDSVLDVLKRVEDLTSSAGSAFGAEGLEAVAGILQKIAKTITNEPKVTTTVISILSNVMETKELTLETAQNTFGSVNSLITALELLMKSVTTSSSGDFSYVSKNIGVDVREVTKEELGRGLQFNSLSDTAVSYNINAGTETNLETFASLRLPTSLVDRIFVQGVTSHRISFVIYRNSRLFISTKILNDNRKRKTYQRVANTQVISCSVHGQIYTDLPEPVQLRFHLKEAGDNIDKAQCVFWDFAADSGRGDWSSKGCVLVNAKQDTPACHCNHLTNFAVLTNVHESSVVDLEVPDSDPKSNFNLDLKFLNYIGCALVFLSTTAVVLTYMFNKYLLSKQPNKSLLNFCTSLLGLCLSFAIVNMTYQSQNAQKFGKIGCNVVAGFTHYFVLVTLFWTGARCVYDFFNFRTKDSFFTSKAAVFAWGIPAIIVFATSLVTQVDYAESDVCFVGRIPFLASVVAPFALVLICNMGMYIAVILRLQGTHRSTDERHYEDISNSVKEGAAIIMLLGFTYSAAYFTLIPSVDLIAQPVFALCSSVLAFFLFYIYVVRKMEARRFWQSCIFFGSVLQPPSVSSEMSSSDDQEQIKENQPEWYMKERHGFHIRNTGRSGATGGNRTAHFHPESVPLSQIERNRLAEDKAKRSGKRNGAFVDDYY